MKKIIVLFVGVFLVFLIFIIGTNTYFNKSLSHILSDKDTPAAVSRQPDPAAPTLKNYRKLYKKVIRTVYLDPDRQFSMNIITADNIEVARFRNVGEKISEFEGNIPDGKAEFFDTLNGRYGSEYFWKNKRHGQFMEYYKEGQIRREAVYGEGKIITDKEYFIDGIVRMERDFSDAMWITDHDEVGVGKVYHRSGKIRYEWNLTNSNHGGYNKSYDIEGRLIAENFFDENGNFTKGWQLNQRTQQVEWKERK